MSPQLVNQINPVRETHRAVRPRHDLFIAPSMHSNEYMSSYIFAPLELDAASGTPALP